jgi:hypothetical protein
MIGAGCGIGEHNLSQHSVKWCEKSGLNDTAPEPAKAHHVHICAPERLLRMGCRPSGEETVAPHKKGKGLSQPNRSCRFCRLVTGFKGNEVNTFPKIV